MPIILTMPVVVLDIHKLVNYQVGTNYILRLRKASLQREQFNILEIELNALTTIFPQKNKYARTNK